MLFSELTLTPRVLRLEDAAKYVGGPANLKTLRTARWVQPLVQHKSNTSFDVRDLDAAVDRAKREGWPA